MIDTRIQTIKNVLITVLVILNTVLLSLYFQNIQYDTNHFPEQEVEKTTQYMEQQLHLNPQQKVQFRRIRQRHLQYITNQKQQIDKHKMAFYTLLLNEKSPQSDQDSLLKLLMKEEAKLHQANLIHFRAIKDLCYEDQKEAFNQFIHNLINSSSNKQPAINE